jgi:hypothetical protein
LIKRDGLVFAGVLQRDEVSWEPYLSVIQPHMIWHAGWEKGSSVTILFLDIAGLITVKTVIASQSSRY